MGEVRTAEDVQDLGPGPTRLGTGGGGRPEQGRESLLRAAAEARGGGVLFRGRVATKARESRDGRPDRAIEQLGRR
jgi:hypothetical protein